MATGTIMDMEWTDVYRTLAGDVADWGERFHRVFGQCGPDAAQQVLGGIAEWLGTDLVDGMPVMPLEHWVVLDGLGEELLQVCRACLREENGAQLRLRDIINRALEARNSI
jgi:hypothetical protein